MFSNQEKRIEKMREVKILTNSKKVKERKGWEEGASR